MNKKEFDALKVGQRVIVSGKQDGKSFVTEKGVIVTPEYGGSEPGVWLVRFDTWREGHGEDGAHWNFFDYDVKDFTITVDEPVKTKKKKAPRGSQEYKGNGKHEWEVVATHTWRLRVPGGWLYRDDGSCAMAFVPVPEVVGYAV